MKEIVLRIEDAAFEKFMGMVGLCPQVEVVKAYECKIPAKKPKETSEPAQTASAVADDVERFVQRVKDIITLISTHNGEWIDTTTRGYAGRYQLNVDAAGISRVLDELLRDHRNKIMDYLEGKRCCESMTVVCPMVGTILNSRIMNSKDLQFSDIGFALKPFYGVSTAVNYLSRKVRSQEADLLFELTKSLLKKAKKH